MINDWEGPQNGMTSFFVFTRNGVDYKDVGGEKKSYDKLQSVDAIDLHDNGFGLTNWASNSRNGECLLLQD